MNNNENISETKNVSSSFDELKQKFEKIKQMNWIESKSSGNGAGGITLEIMLGKERENFEIPDYEGIEIKTTSQNGFKIGLFNSAPDNDFFEIKRLISTYGYLNKYNMKTFRFYVDTKKYTKIPTGNFIKLKIEDDKEILKLQILNSKGILIEDNVSWSFELLKEKLYRKLKYLALVKVLKKDINGKTYFKYIDMTCYKLKNFDQFIFLIKKGYVRIKFNVVELNQPDGSKKIYDHGTTFDIRTENLYKLFEKI